jgi:uncharacterized membrane protein YqjE
MEAHRIPVDPETGIPDLIGRLGDDSKRLLGDEVRLAKLEMQEDVSRVGKGVMWLGVAFGVGVVALVALTLVVATLIGRWVDGHMWLGALITGVVEVVIGLVLIKKGIAAFGEPSYTLQQTRESLQNTRAWARSVQT